MWQAWDLKLGPLPWGPQHRMPGGGGKRSGRWWQGWAFRAAAWACVRALVPHLKWGSKHPNPCGSQRISGNMGKERPQGPAHVGVPLCPLPLSAASLSGSWSRGEGVRGPRSLWGSVGAGKWGPSSLPPSSLRAARRECCGWEGRPVNSTRFLPLAPEAVSPGSGCRRIWCLMRALFLVWTDVLLLCPTWWWWGADGLSRLCFMKVLFPFARALPSWPVTFQGAHLQIPSPRGLGFNT